MTMLSTSNNPKPSSAPAGKTRTSRDARRTRKSQMSRARKAGGRRTCGKNRDDDDVSDKLEALKRLIPSENQNEVVGADELFRETADYIMVLKTQVVVLQSLIRLYGSDLQNPNAV